MYFDDGYFDGDFKLIKAKLPDGYTRAFKLSNGDVITILNLLLEYEDGLFYEVVKRDKLINPEFLRTGKSFTPNEINSLYSIDNNNK